MLFLLLKVFWLVTVLIPEGHCTVAETTFNPVDAGTVNATGSVWILWVSSKEQTFKKQRNGNPEWGDIMRIHCTCPGLASSAINHSSFCWIIMMEIANE